MEGTRYGDDHEIAALAEALSVNVRVMVHRKNGTKFWLPFGERPDLPTLRLLLEYYSPNSSANHYMSLRLVAPARRVRRVRRRETVNHSNVRRRETVNYSKIIEVDDIVHKL